jgi:outer membrane lipoprotein-sorting protein
LIKKVVLTILSAWATYLAASSFLLGDAQTIKAEYSLKQWDQHGTRQLVQRGHCYYNAPNWFAFKPEDPTKASVVLQPKRIIIIDPLLQQVIQTSVHGKYGLSLQHMHRSKSEWLHDYRLMVHDNGLELHAKSDEQSLQDVRVFYGMKHASHTVWPKKIMLKDAFGQRTELVFSDIDTHAKISHAIFHPKIPEHYELIRGPKS